MNHLIDFDVCALAGRTHFIIFHNYFKSIFEVHFWCSNLMLHSKSKIIRRKTKRKVHNCQKQLNGQRGLEIVVKLGKCHLFR